MAQIASDFMVFLTELGANLAQGIISANMGCPKSSASQWAIPQQRPSDGKWLFLKPLDKYMPLTGVWTIQQNLADLL